MKKILFLMLVSFLGFSAELLAQGDLLVTPSRVVFEGKKQKQELSIVNTGKDSATYTMSFVQKKMNEDGSFTNIDKSESGQMPSDQFLRIFPRKVTLAPGESQVVMVQFKREKNMADGEYRSHLYFRAEQNSKPLGMENPSNDKSKISVELTPVYGMTIPVIVRTGKVDASVSLSNIKFETQNGGAQNLKFEINRKGNSSTYGDITIEFIPNKGKAIKVATVNGVGVYTDLEKRVMNIKLDTNSGKSFTNGKFKAIYKSADKKKQIVYAEGTLDIK